MPLQLMTASLPHRTCMCTLCSTKILCGNVLMPCNERPVRVYLGSIHRGMCM